MTAKYSDEDKTLSIHPNIIIDDCQNKEAKEIPICHTLDRTGEKLCSAPTKEGSLSHLYNYLETHCKNEDTTAKGQYHIKLDQRKVKESLEQTLDRLYEKLEYELLADDENIVICCPLHFVHSQAYQDKKKGIECLVYSIPVEERNENRVLNEFYHQFSDSWNQENYGVRLYTNLGSVALIWFRRIRALFFGDVARNTTEKVIRNGGY